MRGLVDALFGPLDRLLAAIPIEAARWAAAALLVVPVLIVVLTVSRAWTLRGAPSGSRWRDLRIWAVVVTLPYLLLYLLAD